MKTLTFSVLLLSALLSACDDSSPRSEPNTDASLADTTAPDSEPPLSCATPTAIDSAAALLAEIDALTWNWIGPYTSTLPLLSDDLTFSSDVTVEASELGLPQECTSRDDCRATAGFVVPTLQGVTCEAQDTTTWLNLCGKVTFAAGTTIRLQPIFRDTHPAEWNFVPTIEIIASCATPCAADAYRCATNNTCFGSYESYCRLCLAKSNEVCPCLAADGPKANGTECSFMVSGDVMCTGECTDGACEYTGTPGWAGCP